MSRKVLRARSKPAKRRYTPVEILMAGLGGLVVLLVVGMIVSWMVRGG
jgi:hypothetical protein